MLCPYTSGHGHGFFQRKMRKMLAATDTVDDEMVEIAEFSDTVTLSDFDHIVYIYKHAKCEGETAVESENSRDYVVMYKLEGSGTYCQDNQ